MNGLNQIHISICPSIPLWPSPFTVFKTSLSLRLPLCCLKPCKLSEHEFSSLEESGSNLACLMTSLTFSRSSPSYRHLFQLLPRPSASNSNPVLLNPANNSLCITPHRNPLMPPDSPPSEGPVTRLDEKLDNIQGSFSWLPTGPVLNSPHYFLCWPLWLWFKLSISFLHRWGPETDPQSCHLRWLLSSATLWRHTDYNLPSSQVKCYSGNTSQWWNFTSSEKLNQYQ